MRRRQIREEKPRPKRRRRHDDDGDTAPSPVAVPSAHGRELLTRLRVERDTIDQALDLLVRDPRGRTSDA